MKEVATRNLGLSTQQIISEAKLQLSEIEVESFEKDVNLKKTVTNARRPMNSAGVDKPLDTMVLGGEFVVTLSHGNIPGGRFLLHDSRVNEPGQPVILIFASDRGLDFLRTYRNWSIDGTFFCCPKNFAQLFTVNVFKGQSTLPAAFMLLPDKSEQTYSRAFRALCASRFDVFPESVMSGMLTFIFMCCYLFL